MFEIRRVVMTERALQQDLFEKSAQLRKKIKLLRPKSLDLDLLEEQVRSVLNMASENEVVINADEILSGTPSAAPSSSSFPAAQE